MVVFKLLEVYIQEGELFLYLETAIFFLAISSFTSVSLHNGRHFFGIREETRVFLFGDSCVSRTFCNTRNWRIRCQSPEGFKICIFYPPLKISKLSLGPNVIWCNYRAFIAVTKILDITKWTGKRLVSGGLISLSRDTTMEWLTPRLRISRTGHALSQRLFSLPMGNF